MSSTTSCKEVLLSEQLAEPFYELHRDIRENKHTHYVLCGGRGSCKSSFISLEIIHGIKENPEANAVAVRKTGRYLRDSVFEQLVWAIGTLDNPENWDCKVSVPEIVYKKTGQKILLCGADNPRKLKSTKVSSGYIRYVWYEEADEFSGQEEIDIINQSMLRGGSVFACFYSFNPPKSKNSWVNSTLMLSRPDRLVHKSDYRSVPREWLGERFIAEAEYLRKSSPLRYENEYLGEPTGSGAEIFPNVSLREITDEEISAGERVCRGLDWGYGADPFVYLALIFDKSRRRILIYYEFYQYGAKFDHIARAINSENPHSRTVIAESAEPRSNDELRDRGVKIRAAKKGAGSIEHGLRWLANLSEIVIDPRRCPNAGREFTGYRFESDGTGGFRGGFPDRDNHTIDAARYALEDYIERRRAAALDRRKLGI